MAVTKEIKQKSAFVQKAYLPKANYNQQLLETSMIVVMHACIMSLIAGGSLIVDII